MESKHKGTQVLDQGIVQKHVDLQYTPNVIPIPMEDDAFPASHAAPVTCINVKIASGTIIDTDTEVKKQVMNEERMEEYNKENLRKWRTFLLPLKPLRLSPKHKREITEFPGDVNCLSTSIGEKLLTSQKTNIQVETDQSDAYKFKKLFSDSVSEPTSRNKQNNKVHEQKSFDEMYTDDIEYDEDVQIFDKPDDKRKRKAFDEMSTFDIRYNEDIKKLEKPDEKQFPVHDMPTADIENDTNEIISDKEVDNTVEANLDWYTKTDVKRKAGGESKMDPNISQTFLARDDKAQFDSTSPITNEKHSVDDVSNIIIVDFKRSYEETDSSINIPPMKRSKIKTDLKTDQFEPLNLIMHETKADDNESNEIADIQDGADKTEVTFSSPEEYLTGETIRDDLEYKDNPKMKDADNEPNKVDLDVYLISAEKGTQIEPIVIDESDEENIEANLQSKCTNGRENEEFKTADNIGIMSLHETNKSNMMALGKNNHTQETGSNMETKARDEKEDKFILDNEDNCNVFAHVRNKAFKYEIDQNEHTLEIADTEVNTTDIQNEGEKCEKEIINLTYDASKHTDNMEMEEKLLFENSIHRSSEKLTLDPADIGGFTKLAKKFSIVNDDRERRKFVPSPSKSDKNIPISSWNLQKLANYIDFECVKPLQISEKMGNGCKNKYNAIAQSIMKRKKMIQIRSEQDSRLILDAVLMPVCELFGLSLETEQTINCKYLPPCKFDYRLLKEDKLLGSIEAKSPNSMNEKAVVQSVLQLLVLQAEKINSMKNSQSTLSYSGFNILTDGIRFVFIRINGNNLEFEHSDVKRLKVHSADTEEEYESLLDVMCSVVKEHLDDDERGSL